VVVISAPAVALLFLAKNMSGKFANQARKAAMTMEVTFIVVSNLGTVLDYDQTATQVMMLLV